MAVQVDRSACNACGSCVEVCPSDALLLEDNALKIIDDNCIDCGQCVDECPNGALALP
jgi:ferredoxin